MIKITKKQQTTIILDLNQESAQNSELDKFEADLLDMVHNIKFRNVNNKFQNKLNEDISKIKKSTKAFIPADKTSHFYKLDKMQHDKLPTESITTT